MCGNFPRRQQTDVAPPVTNPLLRYPLPGFGKQDVHMRNAFHGQFDAWPHLHPVQTTQATP